MGDDFFALLLKTASSTGAAPAAPLPRRTSTSLPCPPGTPPYRSPASSSKRLGCAWGRKPSGSRMRFLLPPSTEMRVWVEPRRYPWAPFACLSDAERGQKVAEWSDYFKPLELRFKIVDVWGFLEIPREAQVVAYMGLRPRNGHGTRCAISYAPESAIRPRSQA